jgi:hypothetical protein
MVLWSLHLRRKGRAHSSLVLLVRIELKGPIVSVMVPAAKEERKGTQ